MCVLPLFVQTGPSQTGVRDTCHPQDNSHRNTSAMGVLLGGHPHMGAEVAGKTRRAETPGEGGPSAPPPWAPGPFLCVQPPDALRAGAPDLTHQGSPPSSVLPGKCSRPPAPVGCGMVILFLQCLLSLLRTGPLGWRGRRVSGAWLINRRSSRLGLGPKGCVSPGRIASVVSHYSPKGSTFHVPFVGV